MDVIPRTFEEWKSCIVNDCKNPLTAAFATQRLAVLENQAHPETRKFVELYGQAYLERIVYWFKQIEQSSNA